MTHQPNPKWVHPNTITGAPAEGAKYFRRDEIEEVIWREIAKGNHVVFLAPRRVGKSSVVKYMALNPPLDLLCSYQDIESITGNNEFFQRLFEMAIKACNSHTKARHFVERIIKKYSIKSISLEGGIEIDKQEINYRELFFSFLDELQANDLKMVLFLDEFPDVVKKIVKYRGVEEADDLLSDLRAIRQNPKFSKNFCLVLLGSVGLGHVVKQTMGRSSKINDLHSINLPPLETGEALEFIDYLTKGASMHIPIEIKNHILSRLGTPIPYFIQLLLEECNSLLSMKPEETLSVDDVDLAYIAIVSQNKHFTDWKSRLRDYFEKNEFDFYMSVLTACAHRKGLSIQEMQAISFKYGFQNDYGNDRRCSHPGWVFIHG